MKKKCFFTENQIDHIDYKATNILKKFVNPYGRIMASKHTGTCASKQRDLAKAIKQSRYMGLLPYINR